MDEFQRITLVRVVDDDEVVRESYKFLLESEGWLVKVYKDAEDFLAHDNPWIPGCAIFDVRMPNMSGLELQQKVRELSREIPIVFVSGHGDIEMAVYAIKNGACDFLPKPVDDEKLLNTIAECVQKDLQRIKDNEDKSQAQSQLSKLSPREREVAELISQGLLNKQIAFELNLSERTVQVHRSNVFHKLGLRSAAQLGRLFASIGKGVK